MPTKPKTTQPETPDKIQGRDDFQTPNYATRLLLPFIPRNVTVIWEPACGSYKISNVLIEAGHTVLSTDLKYENNFLTGFANLLEGDAIITNPPFSLKRKFYERCKSYNVPFALLIPFDMNMWLCDAFEKDCQALVPNRRVNYITPNGKSGNNSSAQFHSMWLTWGFNLPKQLTVVELTKEEMKDI